MVTQVRKVQLSVSVRPELKELAEEIARENNTTTSGVISQCLEDIAKIRRTKLMEEGYKAMAKEHEDFVKLSSEAAYEIASSKK